MSENTENYEIITTAQEAVEPHKLDEGIYLTRTGYQVTDLRDKIEAGQHYPNRATGKRTVVDVAAFAGYLAKHGVSNTELWGARDRGTITAVINAHAETDDDSPGIGGWGDHVTTLTLAHSEDWKDWTRIDGQYLPQVTFAEFVEDHLPNFQSPNGAEMLELAQTFRAASKVDFSSSQRLKSGATSLNYTETTEAKAGGTKGSIDVPDSIALGMLSGTPATPTRSPRASGTASTVATSSSASSWTAPRTSCRPRSMGSSTRSRAPRTAPSGPPPDPCAAPTPAAHTTARCWGLGENTTPPLPPRQEHHMSTALRLACRVITGTITTIATLAGWARSTATTDDADRARARRRR